MGRRKNPPRRSARKAGEEPRVLRRGKKFHKDIQEEWIKEAEGAVKVEHRVRDLEGRRRRIDVCVDSETELVTVVELKRTDWDRIRPHRIRITAMRHARQIWDYCEPYLDGKVPRKDGKGFLKPADVCPGIIYDMVPRRRGLLEQVESVLNARCVQVVWRRETIGERRARADSPTTDSQAKNRRMQAVLRESQER